MKTTFDGMTSFIKETQQTVEPELLILFSHMASWLAATRLNWSFGTKVKAFEQ